MRESWEIGEGGVGEGKGEGREEVDRSESEVVINEENGSAMLWWLVVGSRARETRRRRARV